MDRCYTSNFANVAYSDVQRTTYSPVSFSRLVPTPLLSLARHILGADEIFHTSELRQHVKRVINAGTSVMKSRRNIFVLV